MPDTLFDPTGTENCPFWAYDPIGIRWWAFRLDHPEVEECLFDLVCQWMRLRPGKRVGMKMLWERLRWEQAVGNLDGIDYKLNNNHVALYARWLIELHPELDVLFDTRARHTEGTDRTC